MRLVAILGGIAAASGVSADTRVGVAAFGDFRQDAPGVIRRITPDDIATTPTNPAAAFPAIVARPADAVLKVPPGFAVAAFAKLDHPRQIRIAANGDIFVAETEAGRIRILRAVDGGAAPTVNSVFAEGLDRPFGIAFYPAGANPKWVYVANNNSVVRYAFQSGDLKARSSPEVIVAKISDTSGGHTTRDIAFSADGKTLLVSVGSSSNLAETMGRKTPVEIAAWEKQHGLGASWGRDADRADVLAFDPDGGGRRSFANGIRNCVSMAVNPATRDLWCVTNERDSLGDDIPPEYATRVKPGGFYGWPWYFIGAHEDPRKKGERPDLAVKVAMPDVLIQPHSAPLGLTFYPRTNAPGAFPVEYRGDAFVALHGSWNRSKRTGYKVVRLKLNNGVPVGSYEDFLVGFAVDDRGVWGRPVGVAVAHDGALLVTDDGSGTLWRVAPVPQVRASK